MDEINKILKRIKAKKKELAYLTYFEDVKTFQQMLVQFGVIEDGEEVNELRHEVGDFLFIFGRSYDYNNGVETSHISVKRTSTDTWVYLELYNQATLTDLENLLNGEYPYKPLRAVLTGLGMAQVGS